MASSPIAGREPISDATEGVRSLRQRRELVDDQAAAVAHLAPLRGGDGDTDAAAAATILDNVIELDPPALRRIGGAHHRSLHAPAPARIAPRGVLLAVRVADMIIVGVIGLLAYLWQPAFHGTMAAGEGSAIEPAAAFAALAIFAMLARFPVAAPRLMSDLAQQRRRLVRCLADATLRSLAPFIVALAVVIAVLPADHAVRAPLMHWLTLWAIGTLAGICAVRLGLAGAIAQWRRHGRLQQAVAIYGTGDIAERLLARLEATASDDIELVGVFDDRERRRIAHTGLRSLAVGTAEDLVALSRRRDIDRVFVALPHAAEQRVVDILSKLRQMPVEISLAPDLVGFNVPCREPDDLGGLPFVDVYGRPLTFGQVLLKGAVDRTLAAAALTLGAPLFLALALAIKLDTKGPVFFRQNRYGFADRMIKVYKFRTMTAAAADHDGELQTQRNDPRVTRIGRFLRRWSLDELPQLINVLRGEMSLVGPRPHAVCMRVEDRLNHDVVPDYARRHHMKPGITGWAQINGYHGPVVTEEALLARVRYDLEYITNWSVWFDLSIMLRTVRIVLGKRHAY